MTKLSALTEKLPAKLLLVGDPGTGKTGSICGLVKAGQRVFIQNYEGDAHLAPLHMFLTEDEKERVVVQTLKDDLHLEANKFFWPKKPPSALSRGMHLLDRWTDDDGTDYGSIYEWGPDTTLVVDSLTSMGKAAMWHRLFINQRKGKNKRPKDWGEAMEMQENFLDALRSDNVKCNVVVIAHLTLLSGDGDDGDDDDEPEAGETKKQNRGGRKAIDFMRYPSALGKKLPPKVSGMFPTVIQADIVGSGRTAKRVLRTMPAPDLGLKVPALGLPAELPIETGLVRIFDAVRGKQAQ